MLDSKFILDRTRLKSKAAFLFTYPWKINWSFNLAASQCKIAHGCV